MKMKEIGRGGGRWRQGRGFPSSPLISTSDYFFNLQFMRLCAGLFFSGVNVLTLVFYHLKNV